MNRAVFLDRDGTVNVDVGYLHEKEKLRFIEGVPEALSMFKAMGYKLIVISNQSGIGRGYFGKEDVETLHHYINEMLMARNARIDAFYYCPHTQEDHCVCRKPQTGLFDRAARDWDIDMGASYMVGDKESDIIAAHKLGCGYGLVLSGHTMEETVLRKYEGHIYKNLLDFARHLMEEENGIKG